MQGVDGQQTKPPNIRLLKRKFLHITHSLTQATVRTGSISKAFQLEGRLDIATTNRMQTKTKSRMMSMSRYVLGGTLRWNQDGTRKSSSTPVTGIDVIPTHFIADTSQLQDLASIGLIQRALQKSFYKAI